jgi:alkylation response protein AidB-like acyl-CoA dehydrogenase
MVILEAFGTGLIVEPYIPNIVLSGNLISRLGTQDQKDTILPNLFSGDMHLAFAFAEPQSRFDLNDVTTSAVKDGDNFKLNGYKSVVMNGPAADKLIISARTSGNQMDKSGISLFVVDRDVSGVSLRDYSNVDGSKASELTLENVVLSKDAILGEEGNAFSSIEYVVNLATLAISAEAIGIMQKMNELTLEYTKTREQFGQALSQFQALQHRMVDTFMVHEQTKSLLLMAATKLNDQAEDAVKSISALKYQVGNAAKLIGEESIQLHGGMGVTEEMSIGHYFKRLTTIRTIFGNSDYHLKKYSSL